MSGPDTHDGVDSALRAIARSIESLRKVERILTEMDASKTHTPYNRTRLDIALGLARHGLAVSALDPEVPEGNA